VGLGALGARRVGERRVGGAGGDAGGLSGGERRRLAVACAIAADDDDDGTPPRAIVADEPTTGLDSFQVPSFAPRAPRARASPVHDGPSTTARALRATIALRAVLL